MAWNGAGFFIPPCAPFIKHEGYVLFGVVFVHDGAMLFEYVFYFAAFTHGPVVIVFAELGGCTFASAPSGHGIVVEGEAVHASAYPVHQDFRPVVIVIAGTAGNLEQVVSVIIAAIGRVTAI